MLSPLWNRILVATSAKNRHDRQAYPDTFKTFDIGLSTTLTATLHCPLSSHKHTLVYCLAVHLLIRSFCQ